MSTAISVLDVSKRFRMTRGRVNTLKERVVRFGRTEHDDFWALRNVSFSVAEGETVGILGHNGSGKSTMLKCVAGILRPTTGEVRVRGRVASLLELGAGFHPDLTGRENVFVNASFLNIPRREIERRLDDIVAFAELERFIDTQVKYYSSGMFVRLGFAVAINVDPDILLVDEVLAVGDEAFQAKCLDRVDEFQKAGKTLVIVTHSADQVRQICNRAVVLDHGNLVADGEPGTAIRIFREHLHGHLHEQPAVDDQPVAQSGVRVVSTVVEATSEPGREFVFATEPATIAVTIEATDPVAIPALDLTLHDSRGEVIYQADTEVLGQPLPPLHGMVDVTFRIASVPMLEGRYPISVRLHDRATGRVVAFADQAAVLDVVNPTRIVGRVAIPLQVELRTGDVAPDLLA